MTKNEFLKRFPWVVDLPCQLQCSECLMVQGGHAKNKDGRWVFIEQHVPICSHYEGLNILHDLTELSP